MIAAHPMVKVTLKSGAAYSITAQGFGDECRAKKEGVAARVAGVKFHDNPYRMIPRTPDDWLYSAWEYGYIHGEFNGTVEPARVSQ